MPPELATALAALVLALAAFVNAEVDRRRAAAHRAELHEHVLDVQRRVGADRRVSDV